MNKSIFEVALTELNDVIIESKALAYDVDVVGSVIVNALKKGRKLITCGNGGSAADALHLSEELVGRYSTERRALASVCLCADVTAITCIGNDYGYNHIFERQLQALGKSGDVLVGFSTSGNSQNVNLAFLAAKLLGVTTVLVSGKNGGSAKGTCDHEIIIPSINTARIQELHTVVLHSWLDLIDSIIW